MADTDPKLEAFLHQQLSQCVEKVERLQGGLVNHTFRLHLKNEFPPISSNSSSQNNLLALCHQLKPKSLIVKIAYPYTAEFGDRIKLPINRQQIEERALDLFNNLCPVTSYIAPRTVNLSAVAHRHETIQIGRVWFWDETNHALVIEDYGPLPNMEQWFSSSKQLSIIEATVAGAQTYGEELGKFLVDMQVSSLPYVEHLNELLFKRELVEYEVANTVDMFEKMRELDELPDVNELLSIYLHYSKYDASRLLSDGQVLAQGDLWASNFLIDENESTLALVDWENAGIRSPAWDLACLLGRSHPVVLTDPSNKPMLSFINAFMDAYRDTATKSKVSWYRDGREQYLFAWDLGILYGVILMYWSMFIECCSTDDKKCSHQRATAELGANYLRRCGTRPTKNVYDFIFHDQFLGRLFQASHPTDVLK